MCVCSGYFSWPERGESPLSFHINLSCQISLGQRYIFLMHSRGKISEAYKLLVLQYGYKL